MQCSINEEQLGKMDAYKRWLDQKIEKLQRQIVSLLRQLDADASMRQINALRDELLDYRTALAKLIAFERDVQR
jgi:hypothetical protein